jgi:hypothetical protein
VTSPDQLNSTDIVDWKQLGPNNTNVSQNFFAMTTPTTAGSTYTELVSGRLDAGFGKIKLASVANGSIDKNDTLLSTNDNGPVTLNFSQSWGIGTYIDAADGGQFTARIQAYAGINSVLDLTLSSNLAGDPIFMGVLDTQQELTSVTYSLTNVATGSQTNFILDKIMFQNTSQARAPIVFAPLVISQLSVDNPEPGALSLMMLGFAALGWKLRSRRNA